jgi:hypothetical protein
MAKKRRVTATAVGQFEIGTTICVKPRVACGSPEVTLRNSRLVAADKVPGADGSRQRRYQYVLIEDLSVAIPVTVSADAAVRQRSLKTEADLAAEDQTGSSAGSAFEADFDAGSDSGSISGSGTASGSGPGSTSGARSGSAAGARPGAGSGTGAEPLADPPIDPAAEPERAPHAGGGSTGDEDPPFSGPASGNDSPQRWTCDNGEERWTCSGSFGFTGSRDRRWRGRHLE